MSEFTIEQIEIFVKKGYGSVAARHTKSALEHYQSLGGGWISVQDAYPKEETEDCRVTYNDIQKEISTDVAEATFLLTNAKGRNRKERANNEYYRGIKSSRVALYVKICDRLANVKYSKETGSSMFEIYKKEGPDFKVMLFTEGLREMFHELDKLYDNE